MYQVYDRNSVCIIPHFGLSDHNDVLLQPKERSAIINSIRKTLKKLDTRPSGRYEFGRYLSSVDWSILEEVETCEAKSQILTDLITTAAYIIMSLMRVKIRVNDPPWVTSDFKKLVKARQQPYSNGETETIFITVNLSTVKGKYFETDSLHLKFGILKKQNLTSGGMQIKALLEWRPLVALSTFVPKYKYQVLTHYRDMKLPT